MRHLRIYDKFSAFITYELQVVNYELWAAILRKWNYELRVPFYELKSNCTSCKFVLRVGNKITSCKLLYASCELLFTSCKFKKIILRVATCVLWVENWKKNISKVASCFLRV